MSKEMILHKTELEALLKMCEKFEVDQVNVVYEEGGGIGYFLSCEVETELNGVEGTFTIPITDESSW